jgi:hypothetical protein
MNRAQLLSTTLLASLIGCGTWEGAPPEPPPAPQTPVPKATTREPQREPPAATAASQAAQRAAIKPQAIEKATVGVGKKGRGYGGDIVTQPLQTRFRAEERLRLLTVDHALKLFQAEHGKLPKSHDEFMDKIIRANQIQLPALPFGDQYWYDAEAGQLMVRHTEEGADRGE